LKRKRERRSGKRKRKKETIFFLQKFSVFISANKTSLRFSFLFLAFLHLFFSPFPNKETKTKPQNPKTKIK